MKRKLNFLMILALLIATSVSAQHRRWIEGNRHVTTEEREIADFTELNIDIACKVIIKQGNKVSLTIHADENLHNVIDTDIVGEKLKIRSDYDIEKRKELTLEITVKDLEEIDIGGAVNMDSEGTLKFSELEMNISGAANLNLDLVVEKFYVDLSGAVNVDLYGKARICEIDLSGSINFDADHFEMEACDIDFSGFGKADINVNRILEAEISGLGIIRYSGNPDKVRKDVSGLGTIKRK